MLEELKRRVCAANLDLVRRGLVVQTFGNVSGIDRERGLVVIKPSGVPYDSLTPESMVVVELGSGKAVDPGLRPSSDTPTHVELYRSFPPLGGIVHTHSLHATAWAQACREIPVLGTTHADYLEGPVPCTRTLQDAEIRSDYEHHTARVMVERWGNRDPLRTPGILVASHGPFAWGSDVEEAVEHAAVLEFLAQLASVTLAVAPGTGPLQPSLIEKHFSRKHGPAAYYGQRHP